MDLLIPFRMAHKMNQKRINVVNKVNSTMARENQCGVFLNCGREFSVASTKAFVCQVTVMTLVAIWFAQNKNFNATKKLRNKMIKELKMLSSNLKKTLDNVNDKSQEIAQQLTGKRHIFFMGQGIAECIAKEGALKMKELTYLHCQQIKLHDLGNNFFCYLKKFPESPIIIIILDKQPDKMQMIEEVERLQGQVNFMPIIVTDIKDKTLRERFETFSSGRVFYVQRSGFALSALLCVVPLQRLAYDLTLALGYHPDKPRNLAKELTT
mmetsp:Transcript_24283/g.37468  ORF Transcript_24283/g.37468 Transcript_24283/m.37468 type:complete len:267 (+) Transcript_24283:1454-2254(+)